MSHIQESEDNKCSVHSAKISMRWTGRCVETAKDFRWPANYLVPGQSNTYQLIPSTNMRQDAAQLPQ